MQVKIIFLTIASLIITSCTSLAQAVIGIPNDNEQVILKFNGELQNINYEIRIITSEDMDNSDKEYRQEYQSLIISSKYKTIEIPGNIKIYCKVYSKILIKIYTNDVIGEIEVKADRFGKNDYFRIKRNSITKYSIIQI